MDEFREDAPNLEKLLLDKKFVDYFNVYLSLPVFLQKACFLFSQKTFHLHPDVENEKDRELDKRAKVIKWLQCRRLPHFFESAFYSDYVLGKALYNCEGKPAAEFCGCVSSLASFKHSLIGSAGDKCFATWKDIEKFKNGEPDFKSIRSLQKKHLAECFREKRNGMLISSDDHFYQPMPQTFHSQCWTNVQFNFLNKMKTYWLPRFLLQQKKQKATLTTQDTLRNDKITSNSVSDRIKDTGLKDRVQNWPGGGGDVRDSDVESMESVPEDDFQGTICTECSCGHKNCTLLLCIAPHKTSDFACRTSIACNILLFDSLTGRPFRSFLVSKNLEKELKFLEFWQAAELCRSALVDSDKSRSAKESLCTILNNRHLQESFEKEAKTLLQILRAGDIDIEHYALEVLQEKVVQQLKEACEEYGQEDLLALPVLMNADITSALPDEQPFLQQRKKQALLLARCTSLTSNSEMAPEDLLFLPKIPEDDYDSLQISHKLLSKARLKEKHKISVLPKLHHKKGMNEDENFCESFSNAAPLKADRQFRQSLSEQYIRTSKTLPSQQSSARNFAELIKKQKQLKLLRKFRKRHRADKSQVQNEIASLINFENVRVRKNPKKLREMLFTLWENEHSIEHSDEVDTRTYGTEYELPSALISAEISVITTLEERWHDQHSAMLPYEKECRRNEEVFNYKGRRSTPKKTDTKTKDKCKAAWKRFISDFVAFHKGLKTEKTSNLFKSFLRDELVHQLEKRSLTHLTRSHASHDPAKINVCNKTVLLAKLRCDLQFWIEVVRFQTMADYIEKAAKAGENTRLDEVTLRRKASAISQCFLHSAVPPKLQVNIPVHVADKLSSSLKQRKLKRGLFHDATMHIFVGLAHEWNRFCRYSVLVKIAKATQGYITATPQPASELSQLCFLNFDAKKIKHVVHTRERVPRLQFSLSQGVCRISNAATADTVKTEGLHQTYTKPMTDIFNLSKCNSISTKL